MMITTKNTSASPLRSHESGGASPYAPRVSSPTSSHYALAFARVENHSYTQQGFLPDLQWLPKILSAQQSTSRLKAGIRSTLTFLLPQLIFFFVLTLVWEAMARWLHSPLVPQVSAIWQECLHIGAHGFAAQEIGITFLRMSLGFILALAVAFPLGILTALSKTAARLVEPGLILGLTVPGLVWALLCVIWFGVGLASPVISVALGVLPSLVISIQQGIQSLSRETTEMTRVFRFNRRTVIFRIWLPLLYSFIISGCRIGFSIAWKVIVLAEIFGMSSGVGYQLNAQFSTQNVEGVIAWTLAFWLAMLLVEYGIFAPLERHSVRWKKVTTA